ncbi:putative fungal pheromoneG-protein-coupled receptor [Exidia glandulosa HHB12029]|uniref:Putative fungal pheromoneG-protein-coupled receptor n=1 Tax=Exidia glandulosa HHB12029 TaxID=1314781 RepID=A0A165D7L6_EXIGL|nr:putative fungal pheromoneG-protein-coupled receptor [Exidia glandulosa HHB12029]
MPDVLYLVFASISIFLVIVPSPWHVAAWNSATCYLMLWTTIGCIIHLVNSIVWHHSLENPAPIYCDISTKITMGLSMAIPLSSLCINRRLHNIATMSSVAVTKAQKRRDVIIDTLIAFVIPLIFMAVHYTMQGHRYDIIENYGCWPATYPTAPAYVLVIAPPVVVCSISLVYATLSLRAFIRRRTEFNQLLKSSSTGLNSGRYFRLMALASSEVLIGLPTSLYFLITDLKTIGVKPWISWEDTHYNFGFINYYPAYYFKFNRATQVALELNRWTFPFIAFIFFAFFGIGEEARKNYRRAFYTVLKPFGVQQPLGTTGKGASQ